MLVVAPSQYYMDAGPVHGSQQRHIHVICLLDREIRFASRMWSHGTRPVSRLDLDRVIQLNIPILVCRESLMGFCQRLHMVIRLL